MLHLPSHKLFVSFSRTMRPLPRSHSAPEALESTFRQAFQFVYACLCIVCMTCADAQGLLSHDEGFWYRANASNPQVTFMVLKIGLFGPRKSTDTQLPYRLHTGAPQSIMILQILRNSEQRALLEYPPRTLPRLEARTESSSADSFTKLVNHSSLDELFQKAACMIEHLTSHDHSPLSAHVCFKRTCAFQIVSSQGNTDC
ncbi:hypothetical protein K469DRAFT_709983 [Zopfia rhizophila CBS 207.26]|uniref:Uncharacterized protein n=1 Tax=Zopfia rhizophila CBS 207.26 TaxID=1314779 RepID=A0A6A6DWX2_9PEZI|nr:hypothetical protein K469DRAFT_709983 [Zopfia rhizophila CBS 207.26]